MPHSYVYVSRDGVGCRGNEPGKVNIDGRRSRRSSPERGESEGMSVAESTNCNVKSPRKHGPKQNERGSVVEANARVGVLDAAFSAPVI